MAAVPTDSLPVVAPEAPKPGEGPKRRKATIEAAFATSMKGESFLPMMSDEATHKALPNMFRKGPMPNLMRVGGLQPKTMDALMVFAKTFRQEGPLDSKFLNDVFWAVSSENECFY